MSSYAGFVNGNAIGLGRRRRTRRGRGFLSVLKASLPYIKKSGIAGDLAGKVHPLLGSLVKSAGYGRRRVVRRRRIGGRRRLTHRRRGRGFLDTLKGIGGAVKDSGIIGNLAMAYNPAAGMVAKTLGFGRRRRVHRRRGRGGVYF